MFGSHEVKVATDPTSSCHFPFPLGLGHLRV